MKGSPVGLSLFVCDGTVITSVSARRSRPSLGSRRREGRRVARGGACAHVSADGDEVERRLAAGELAYPRCGGVGTGAGTADPGV